MGRFKCFLGLVSKGTCCEPRTARGPVVKASIARLEGNRLISLTASDTRMKAPAVRRNPLDTKRERERYYLLPGMGGSALKRKRKTMLQWSIAAGVCFSAIVAYLLYYLYDRSVR